MGQPTVGNDDRDVGAAARPWYRQKFILGCAALSLAALSFLVSDVLATKAKHRAIQAALGQKTEADRLYEAHQYQQAISGYDAMIPVAAEYPDDPKVGKAVADARGSRNRAAADWAAEQERQAKEREAREREAERLLAQRAEEERARQDAAERDLDAEIAKQEVDPAEIAKQEADPRYLGALRGAQEHEDTNPGTAAKYCRDLADLYPKTAVGKTAGAKAKELWARVYGDPGGPPRLAKCSKAGCNNRAREGKDYCDLHDRPTFSGSYSSSIHVGPRGGVYHYSKNGKKVYHKR